MVDFRSGYVPPGVYVTADNSAVSGALGINPTVVCLVGPGLGYQSLSESFTVPDLVTPLNLSQFGIQQPSIVVTYRDGQNNLITLTQDVDYSVVASDFSQPDSVTVINPITSGSLPTYTTITVSYNYANANYFSLNKFSDFASLISLYGTPFTTAGVLQSPISLAAQIAFENGASVLYTIALNNDGQVPDQYNAAYALSETAPEINLVVPIFASLTPDGSAPLIADSNALTSYISGLNGHLISCDQGGYPRTALFGVPETFSDGVSPDTIAQSFSYKRVCFVWPKEFLYYNPARNATTTIGGCYLAAACAGVLANAAINQGLTRRQVRSLSGLTLKAAQLNSVTNKNLWSSKGVAVAEVDRIGRLVIRHGVTTDVSTVVTRELSIVRCQDALFEVVQQSLDQADLIGTPITSDTPMSVKSIIAGALETAKSTGTIQDYSNLAVRQQSLPTGDPTVIECIFAYQPTYPLNYITVVFTLDLTTGNLTTSQDSASQ